MIEPPHIHTDTDVAIIGAGVAGCTAALALSPKYRVTLIDKSATPQARIGECLPPATRRILKRLNLLSLMECSQHSHSECTGIKSYWGSAQPQYVDHLCNPDGNGWHLDRQKFEVDLRQVALQRGVSALWPLKILTSEYTDKHWHLSAQAIDPLHSGRKHQVRAKFVIDASGRQSVFAKRQGAQKQAFDKLVACWATFASANDTSMGIISATESGWWYCAPLPNNERVISLLTDSDLINTTLSKDPVFFSQQASSNRVIADQLPKQCNDIALQGVVAANSTRLDQVAGKQWAALGDAAISFDPLSSQGMFNAMASAMQLSKLLEKLQIIEHPSNEKSLQLKSIYSAQIDNVWKKYLAHKKLYYRQEQRWRNTPFWARRHSPSLN